MVGRGIKEKIIHNIIYTIRGRGTESAGALPSITSASLATLF